MTTNASLFDPTTLGPLNLQNRIVMAPMTRCRATLPGEVPNDLMATYYAQRSTAGLIMSEATHVCPGGLGYWAMPGIFSDAQREGWKRVTDAVHDAGSLIFAQLFHAGRSTVPELLPDGMGPVGPSAIPVPDSYRHTPVGKRTIPTCHELTVPEIEQLVEDFRHAGGTAKAAGFDGVQLHGANGFLINDFLKDGSNHRTDDFGGSLTNRLRFPLAVLDALIDVFGPERVGIRLSPLGEHNGTSDSNVLNHFTEIFKALNARSLGHLEILGAPWTGERHTALNAAAREHFANTLILNFGYTAESAQAALDANAADLISFGKPYIANPDLPHRLQTAADLNEIVDQATLYDPNAGATGYTDYPTLAEASSA
ncbi:MAG: alkene reductase [Planctomycetota bacterium]